MLTRLYTHTHLRIRRTAKRRGERQIVSIYTGYVPDIDLSIYAYIHISSSIYRSIIYTYAPPHPPHRQARKRTLRSFHLYRVSIYLSIYLDLSASRATPNLSIYIYIYISSSIYRSIIYTYAPPHPPHRQAQKRTLRSFHLYRSIYLSISKSAPWATPNLSIYIYIYISSSTYRLYIHNHLSIRRIFFMYTGYRYIYLYPYQSISISFHLSIYLSIGVTR